MMVSITKVGLARAAVGAYLILDYQKEMEENYRKGDWLEAAKDTGFFAVKMLPVVAPAFVFGTLGPVWIGAAVGVGATMAIVELTGIGEWQDVRDLILDPDPKEWYDVVAPEVKREVKEAVTLTLGLGGFLLRGVGTYAEKKVEQVEAGYEWLTKYGKWANPVGLPF